jgi:hypothetical protein
MSAQCPIERVKFLTEHVQRNKMLKIRSHVVRQTSSIRDDMGFRHHTRVAILRKPLFEIHTFIRLHTLARQLPTRGKQPTDMIDQLLTALAILGSQ